MGTRSSRRLSPPTGASWLPHRTTAPPRCGICGCRRGLRSPERRTAAGSTWLGTDVGCRGDCLLGPLKERQEHERQLGRPGRTRLAARCVARRHCAHTGESILEVLAALRSVVGNPKTRRREIPACPARHLPYLAGVAAPDVAVGVPLTGHRPRLSPGPRRERRVPDGAPRDAPAYH